MDNFSVRSERNFHNLAAKPKRMHLLDKPNGYASAMVKSSLPHQMRFTVQALEKELYTAGDPHVLQIKLLGDDSRELSSLPTARASQAVRVTLPASASARELRCFWTCVATPSRLPSCASGARGSTSCWVPRAGLRGV